MALVIFTVLALPEFRLLAVNNLGDIHPITAVAASSTKSNVAAPGDVLTLMAGRSVSASITIGFSPKSH